MPAGPPLPPKAAAPAGRGTSPPARRRAAPAWDTPAHVRHAQRSCVPGAVGPRRPAHRPVRQVRPPGGRPPPGRAGPPRHRRLRRAGARPRAHPHLPDHAAGPVERARRGPGRGDGRPHAHHLLALPGAARPAHRDRRDDEPLRPPPAAHRPRPRPGPARHRRAGPGGGHALQAHQGPAGDAARGGRCRRPPLRARSPQAGAHQAGLAGRGPGRLRRRRGPPHHPDRLPRHLPAAPLPERGGGELLVGGLGRGRPALRGRQDPRGRSLHGQELNDDAHPGHQRGLGASVEGGAHPLHHPDRGGDRRVLRLAQGGPPRHDRHLPGAHHSPQGRLPAPGPAGLP